MFCGLNLPSFMANTRSIHVTTGFHRVLGKQALPNIQRHPEKAHTQTQSIQDSTGAIRPEVINRFSCSTQLSMKF